MAKRMVIFVGTDEPQKAFAPFMLGSGALAMEMEVFMFFSMNGLNIIRKNGAKRIKLEGSAKTLPEYIDIMREEGARLVACSGALLVMNMREDELIEGVECAGIATFVDEASKADVVLTF